MDDSTIELLLNCEKNGIAPPYVVHADTYKTTKASLLRQPLPVWTEPCKHSSDQEDVFIISDLHMAAGRNALGVYRGTENFFADEAFARFLTHANKIKKSSQAILVMNGDTFDFLRTSEYPGKIKRRSLSKRISQYFKFGTPMAALVPDPEGLEAEYHLWSEELRKCGIAKTARQLKESITAKELEYGLQTDDYKTIYKLMCIRRGHPAFFTALAAWMEAGNKLIILKGNHDLELYWPAVRNYFRLLLSEAMAQQGNLKQTLLQKVLPNITFVDDAIAINDTLFIEHGHRFDKFTAVLPGPTLENKPNQLNIPFGSFFNRYLINKIELFYPNLDKVRPSGNLLPMLMKENFPLAVKVLLKHAPFVLRIFSTNLKYIWFMFDRVVWWLLILLIPIVVIGCGIYKHRHLLEQLKTHTALGFILGQLKHICLLLLSYFLCRLMAWFQLEEPSSLNNYAKIKFSGKPYKTVVMGHTHNPGSYTLGPDVCFFNTGTWIPVIEISSAEVREDRTFTFLHLTWNEDQKLVTANNGMLQRWNDDALRVEQQLLVERKG